MKTLKLILFLIGAPYLLSQTPYETIHRTEIKSVNRVVFSELQSLSDHKNTRFLSSTELPFITSKNGIYSASFPMAWNEIKELLLDSIYDFSSMELELVHQTKGHVNALYPSEYQTSISIENKAIVAEAFFYESLPFSIPMIANNKALFFQKTPVQSFGFQGKHPGVRILYYNNDDDFALSIETKEIGHELILIKTNFNAQSSINNELEQLQIRMILAKENNTNAHWKEKLYSFDIATIPIIDFNIEHRYPGIEKSFFNNKGKKYIVSKAYQKNDFSMDENGAEIKSEALIQIQPPSRPYGIDEAIPKKMILDDSFLILAKHTDNPNPYLAIFICNDELMHTFN